MKVTSVGTSPLMVHGLLSGFNKLGISTSTFPFEPWIKLHDDEGVSLLRKYLDESRPDYLVFGGYGPIYFQKLTDLCLEFGIGFIYWAIEDPIGFKQTLSLAKMADVVFTTTVECIEKYKELGIKAHLLPFACNPDYHKTGDFQDEYSGDIALVASFYNWGDQVRGSRVKGYNIILESAKKSGYSLKVWGAGWDRKTGKQQLGDLSLFHGYFPNNELPHLCASTKIILGVQCDDSSNTQTSMRPYEILGCRGFHLTQWTKATESIFQEANHLVTAKSQDEALEKIAYYINHPEERNKIASQGQEFVYKNHTYEKRVKEIILPNI